MSTFVRTETCPDCDGHGHREQRIWGKLDTYQDKDVTCQRCGGTGKIHIYEHCKTCHGYGYIRKDVQVGTFTDGCPKIENKIIQCPGSCGGISSLP